MARKQRPPRGDAARQAGESDRRRPLAAIGPLAFLWTTALVALLLLPVEAARYGFVTLQSLAAHWPGDPAAERLGAAALALGAGRVAILSALLVAVVRLWMLALHDGVLPALGAGAMVWAMSFGYALSTLALLRLAPPDSLVVSAALTAAACLAGALVARWGLRPAAEDDAEAGS